MSTPCLARRLRPSSCLQTAEPLFGSLAPSLLPRRVHPVPCISRFSTSQSQLYPRRDRNSDRGVSAVRRTGLRPRQTLSVKKLDLPTPVLDPSKRSKVQVDEDHGLWQFFGTERRAMALPEEVGAHGQWVHTTIRSSVTEAFATQVEHGRWRSLGTRVGMISTPFGGFARRSATGSRPKHTNCFGLKAGTASTRLKNETKRYVRTFSPALDSSC